jgi:murein DD-endopeptidase MepM/ murein hydrolase activator NlpD
MEKITASRCFNLLSWGITAIFVAAMIGLVFLHSQSGATSAAVFSQEAAAGQAVTPVSQALPPLVAAGPSFFRQPAIERKLTLKTNIPDDRPRYDVVVHTVEPGDSVFGIAKHYNIKPDTLLWANYDVLNDTPDSLRPGQKLDVPPTDGILYKWKAGDMLGAVAQQYKAAPNDILDWPGNDIDLADPHFKADQLVMIPGGSREYKQWLIPVPPHPHSGTAAMTGSVCSGGPVGSGAFVWPAQNHFLSGNDFYAGHLGIDIAAGAGAPVYAADAGIVTKADTGWNSGYGNVIMIDHNDGFVTLYGHLSQFNIKLCQSVYAGELIGLAGDTGNSFGAHLHFEVRENGGFINPWNVLPAP